MVYGWLKASLLVLKGTLERMEWKLVFWFWKKLTKLGNGRLLALIFASLHVYKIIISVKQHSAVKKITPLRGSLTMLSNQLSSVSNRAKRRTEVKIILFFLLASLNEWDKVLVVIFVHLLLFLRKLDLKFLISRSC